MLIFVAARIFPDFIDTTCLPYTLCTVHSSICNLYECTHRHSHTRIALDFISKWLCEWLHSRLESADWVNCNKHESVQVQFNVRLRNSRSDYLFSAQWLASWLALCSHTLSHVCSHDSSNRMHCASNAAFPIGPLHCTLMPTHSLHSDECSLTLHCDCVPCLLRKKER